MSPTAEHPLRRLDGGRLGPHRLRLTELRPGEKSGWRRFTLVVGGAAGEFAPPVIEGLYSAGGRGVPAWIEVLAYAPRLQLQGEVLDLPAQGLEPTLFSALSELIPPGGHLMVGCESPPHQPTYQALLKRVPPAATPLGSALFECGFRKVKFFYLAEGGWEGQQKLWGEKPVDEEMKRQWDAATVSELRAFLAAPAPAPAATECLPRARELLESLSGRPAGRAAASGREPPTP